MNQNLTKLAKAGIEPALTDEQKHGTIHDLFGKLNEGWEMEKDVLKKQRKLAPCTQILVGDLEFLLEKLFTDNEQESMKLLSAIIEKAKLENFHDFYGNEDVVELFEYLKFVKGAENIISFAKDGKYDTKKQ
jgi:hypothetical protein